MKGKLVRGIVLLLVVVAIGWVFAHQATARHVSMVEAEIKLLEETLKEAAEKFYAGTIEAEEIFDYNKRIIAHLDKVDEHPRSTSLVGYSDFHLNIFSDLAGTLEDFKEEHNDMLLAFDIDSFDVNIDINPSQPPPFPDTTELPAATTITETDNETDIFDNAILTFNDAWVYCPGTDPKCWDTGTFFD